MRQIDWGETGGLCSFYHLFAAYIEPSERVPFRNPTGRQRMAVLEGEKQGGSRCIMVGLRMNAKGKELLDWAIHKVAEQGDRVIAIHVCRDSEVQHRQSLRNLLYPSEARATRKHEEKTDVETRRSSDSNHVKGEMVDAVLSSVTVLVRHLPEPVLGWPLMKKKATPRRIELIEELNTVLSGSNLSRRWFQYEELQSSTNRRVYRGRLRNGQQVAIKLSKLSSAEASKDFLSEVDIITKLKHLRVVPLLGLCVEEHTLISVYRYFPSGSLEQNLHGKYLAPEYLMYGKVSNKNDVYAFGVVLLELLTGRKPIDDGKPKGEESLVMWVSDANSGERGAHRSAGSQSGQADGMSEEVVDCPDDEAYPTPTLALIDVDDDASVASVKQSQCGSWEAYLRGRWSRSSSFN
ncbi:hypothetical protein GW17_00036120 [Ensete ventricosum]|nr:hypothetical protein GW17_00036120 [Ensete ventricosum]